MGIYLSIISLVFILIFYHYCVRSLSDIENAMIFLSIFRSLVCFKSKNIYLFWVSYELTILPLLICIIVKSPYSERFLAFWYLLTYVVLTSLPMLLLLLLYSYKLNSIKIVGIPVIKKTVRFSVIKLFLFILFSRKIPLLPFHSWLPVVHAEARTFVSVVLSGYVMKLGLIGVIRFCLVRLETLLYVVLIIFIFSILFFSASSAELDTKR